MAEDRQRPEIVIKHNKYARHGACVLCNTDRSLCVGPCLFVDGTWDGVCETCAHMHAPGLAAMIGDPEAQHAYWLALGRAAAGKSAREERLVLLEGQLAQLRGLVAVTEAQIDRLKAEAS
jgi:hypothetical protein